MIPAGAYGRAMIELIGWGYFSLFVISMIAIYGIIVFSLLKVSSRDDCPDKPALKKE
jgi:hypothetical protein